MMMMMTLTTVLPRYNYNSAKVKHGVTIIIIKHLTI